MVLALTEEQSMVQNLARRICEDKIAPLAAAVDQGKASQGFLDNLQLLSQNGFMGLAIDPDFGGTGAGSVAFALTIEELAKGCASTAVTVSVSNMVAEVIQAVGTAKQKQKYLPKLCDGTYPAGAFCLTEACAGSDPSAMKTRAAESDNGFILNGTKLYITSASFAGLLVVWAVTDNDAEKGKGISCFLVEADTPGLTIGKKEEKLGQHGSPTHEVIFDKCEIPSSALLGQLNGGFRIAVGELAGGRIGIASLALGIAEAAMDAGKAWVMERKQFGKKLGEMQGLQWMIADRETDIEAARLLIRNAASLKEQGKPYSKEASMAKLFASEMAQRATYTALQLHGGAGYIKDFPLERYSRDARITTIYEGTSEIQRLIIARETLKSFR
ncbi:MAG: acyl-CoA dehydrogenase family protein [Cohaesibacteraceae bacterium]|nr:acyl-CoA dehydrogenase family protein [Cohaesibacteraceae bacterium]